ncbi:uncharacterized protein LOC121242444 [Juglans microcarpa x Juglans regia]|uniref:uncharacterized protein LOC121242444 n=1 Tax=Juglans microcarpa x Juglans regia TaxID=2249226 RepID=UPI001B7E2ADB|nr:uncharacterized protein LOC121242444 [Juglans microcarpa x Juglans regia]
MSCLSWNCRGLGNPRTVRELHFLVKNKAPSFVFLMETKCKRSKVEKIKRLLNMENSFVVDCKGLSGGLAFLWKEDVDAVLVSYTMKGSWQLLRKLKPENDVGWLCVGDFNEIISTNEKVGGPLRPYGQMECFREALEDCDLTDMGYVGNKFTWSNNRGGIEFTKERLDRALCNPQWAAWNTGVVTLSLTALNSDHCPIFITNGNHQQGAGSHTKIFRYEVSWGQREECNKLIADEWKRPRLASNELSYTTEGLKRCQFKLQQWSKQAGDKHDSIKGLKAEFEKVLEEENLKWQQRAKQRWLKEGDRNTKYFHQCASQRRKVIRISKLIDDRDQEITNASAICQQFQAFFQELFTTANPQNIDGCLAATNPIVTNDMNQALMRPYCAQEIEEVLFQMDGLSSPGPNGFPAAFYQQNWDVVGRQIISKVIANRLKKILPSIISQNQSAFIPRRLISDNVIVAFEALHSMNCKMAGREGYMAMKLDMSKAYDRVEWSFLRAALCKMGFDFAWIELVMRCVESVSYSILVNGVPQSEFRPSRGIRQGDPLSPYLFIMCAEALSSMISKGVEEGVISRVPFARGRIRISHLFFADDSLLFCKANALEWGKLHNMLKIYEEASGQRLNLKKTSIQFSRNTAKATQDFILSIAGVRSSMAYEKYLGLPTVVGKTREKSFRDILDRVRMRVLRAKYFQETSFMNAELGQKPSYIWSILKARNLIDAGYFWRIGSGDKVRIWGDKWLPKTIPSIVKSPISQLDGNAKVQEMLKPGEKRWNMELVEHIFCKEDADLIAQIPISSSTSPDQLIWKGTSSGFFTVKSAYHMHQEMNQALKGQPSSSHNFKEVWKTLWQLQVSPGEKVFLWRACLNALPTQSNLFKKKIVEHPKCPICEIEEETVAHALWDCESARDVWSQCTKSIQKRHFPHMDFSEIFKAIAE